MNETDSLTEKFTVRAEDAGQRLDAFVASVSELSRSAATRLIENGSVTLNGGTAPKNGRLREGDVISLTVPEPEEWEVLPENIPLDIVYEDDDIIVVNKPFGMVVHPAAGNLNGTLVNALLYHCKDSLSGVGGVIRPGIVHRIDKDTEGLLVVAKNDFSHIALSSQLKGHHLDRIYEAIAIGNFKEDQGTVNAPIGRHPTDRKRMAVLRGEGQSAKEAITHWEVLHRGVADGQSFTHLRCRLETGRTHQIRVHMASLGHPLLGDPVYRGDGTAFQSRHQALIKGQCLQAVCLMLDHPRTGERMVFSVPVSERMQRLMHLIFKEENDTERERNEDSVF